MVSSLRRVLSNFASKLDRERQTTGVIELDALTQKRVSYSFSVNVTLVHPALGGVLGAIFGFKKMRFEFQGKKYAVEFLLVCAQIIPHMPVSDTNVHISKVTPALGVLTYPRFEREFEKYLVQEWNL